jgi:2-keto-4-pentenoate hydratase/2-oxohepta-3-ene-1,7-dioic acid hydratase in catechol pathway
MKLVLYEMSSAPAGATLGVLTPRGVVPLVDVLGAGGSPQEALVQVIDTFDELRPRLESLAADGSPQPLNRLRLLAPVPRPGKIVLTTAVYAGGASIERQQLLMTLKSAESVIGPGETIRLPQAGDQWQFVPQAALGLVIRGPSKGVSAGAWRTAVFGYTCVVDVMARGDQQMGRDFWLAKADTLGPLGPCILTADEVSDPSALRVRSWQNGVPAQEYGVADASHSIPEQIEFATTVLTLHSGDVLACGTSPSGQRPLADCDRVEVDIEPIGRLALGVGRASAAASAIASTRA